MSALSLFLICFGCECQLNAWKVKIQKLCSRHIHLGPNKQMSRSSQKNKAFFFLSLVCPISAMFSPHQNPLAIVQQRTASLHMFSDCSITLLLPPAHFFNRPFWLTCYIKMICAVISFSLPQHCKTVLSTAQSAAVWNMIAKHQH